LLQEVGCKERRLDGLMDQTKVESFLEKLVNADYNGEAAHILSQMDADFDKCVSMIHKRKQVLESADTY
jgi:hypothetical protein